MDINEMKRRKKELGYTNAMIAEKAGVPLGTVQKIFGGATAAPRYSTMKAIEDVLSRRNLFLHEEELRYEAAPKGRKQGEYTLDDYFNLPDDIRAELIDGVLYQMSAPNKAHQIIAGLVFTKLMNFKLSTGHSCMPFISPIDVNLDNDDRTMVQPDVIVVCEKNTNNKYVEGAPDFVMEVLSPANRGHDMIRKLNKYYSAGVREYWMVDPDKREILVYDFDRDNLGIRYTFDDVVPVLISDGAISIDFKELAGVLDEYLV